MWHSKETGKVMKTGAKYIKTANVSCKKCQQHRVNAIFGSSSYLKSWQFYNSGKMTKHTLSYAFSWPQSDLNCETKRMNKKVDDL